MYKIEKIVLDGYKRLQLGQIGHIEMNFNKRDQIIIGTNGSGKSSIFHELSALPADNKNYEKTGRKEIHIRKDGKSIVATSTFDPKPFHSFLVEGEEMNESGLITIQKELSEKYTGVTAEVHELMMGKILFTAMSSNERRQWFTRLSDANYEYLIDVYLKFKDEVRDITGALRLAKNKLVAETSKAIKDEELQGVRKDVEVLYELIEHLSEKRIPIDRTAESLQSERSSILQAITEADQTATKFFNYLKKYPDLDPASIETQLSNAVVNFKLFKMREHEFFVKHAEQNEVFEILEKTKLESVAKLSSDIEYIRKEIHLLQADKCFPMVHTNPAEALAAIESIQATIEDISSNIDSNPERSVYNQETHRALKEKIENLTQHRQRLNNKVTEITTLVEHAQKHLHEGQINCPNCNHQWMRGIGVDDIAAFEVQLGKLANDVAQTTQELTVLAEDQHRFKTYSEYLKAYRNIVSYTGILGDFWSHVSNENLIELKPSAISNQLLNYAGDVKKDIQLHELQRNLADKLKLLDLTHETKEYDYTTVKKNLEQLDAQMREINTSLRRAHDEQEELTKVNHSLKQLERTRQELQRLLNSIHTNTSEVMENHRRQAYNAILRNLQSILATKERTLQESVNQINLIKNLEQEIAFLSEKEKALKVGLKVMSPTEGLIAKGLYGFMQIFIRNMNAVIGKIWSYPFVVKPCNSGGEGSIDLTYKFPMVVNGQEGAHKDVSEGSSAMIEVVDIAFRVCALKALKLGDTPLFLDEFGKTMDSVHRRATTNLITTLMEEDSFSQMFFISHDISQYGALSNCEVCVLNDMNVILPPNSIYNKHVTMY